MFSISHHTTIIAIVERNNNNIIRKMLNSHLFWLKSHPAHLNQVLDTPDVQVQEPLVVVKKRDKVWI